MGYKTRVYKRRRVGDREYSIDGREQEQGHGCQNDSGKEGVYRRAPPRPHQQRQAGKQNGAVYRYGNAHGCGRVGVENETPPVRFHPYDQRQDGEQ